MDSPLNTDFPVEINGKSYTLAFPIPAIWAFEDATGEQFFVERSKEEIEEMTKAAESMPLRKRMERTAAALWAGLRLHHPEVTREQASAMLFPHNFAPVAEKVWAAFNATMAMAREKDDAKEETDRPLAVN